MVALAIVALATMGCAGDETLGSRTGTEGGSGTGGGGVTTAGPDADGGGGGGGEEIRGAGSLAQIAQLTPKRGPTSGGTLVSLGGAGFMDGIKVYFGDAEAPLVKVVGTGRLAAITPAGVSGPADVRVVTPDGGESTFPKGFEFYELGSDAKPAPSLLKTTPNTGPSSGGTALLLRGQNFQPGASVFIDWQLVPWATVTSGEWIYFLTPSMSVGPVSVAVTNPDGQSDILESAFAAYDNRETAPAPRLTKVHPRATSVEGGVTVSVEGSGFNDDSTLILGGLPVDGWTVESPTRGTFVAPPHVPGLLFVAISNPDGLSDVLQDAFQYFTAPPVVYEVVPSQGPPEGGNEVTVKGNHFQDGAGVNFDNGACGGASVVDPQTIRCTVPPAAAAVEVAVTVKNPDGLSGTLPRAYRYLAPENPVLTTVIPSTGPVAGGGVVLLLGTGFPANPTVRFGDSLVTEFLSADASSLSVVLPAGTAGTVDVTVGGPGVLDAVLPEAFTYVEPGPPTLTGIAPAEAPAQGGTVVALTGTDLRPGAQVWFGDAKSPTVWYGGPQGMSASVPPHAAGTVDVRLITPGYDDSVLTGAFTFTQPGPPTLTGITPTSGSAEGGIVVALTGTNLRAGATLWFGDVQATKTWFGGPAGMSAQVPAHAPGSVDVRLSTPGFPDSTLPAAFTFVEPGAPLLTGVAPASGPVEGGIVVAVTGENIRETSVLRFGTTPATNVLIRSAGGLTVTLPPGVAGAVDVALDTPSFQTSVLSKAFTYTQPGAPKVLAVSPTEGPTEGGIVVAVTGTDLRADSVVWFGATPAQTHYFAGPDGIAVVLPAVAAAGTVDVVVKTPGQPDTKLTQGFSYVAAPAPAVAAVTPAEGPTEGGILVAVSGQGLRANAQVWFGGTKASETIYGGPNGITARLPAGVAGTVDVRVITPGFPDAVLPGAFTYTQPGPPQATAVTPTSGPVDGGIVVVVSGVNFRSGSQVTFGGTAAQTLYLTGPTGIAVMLPPGAVGPVDVVVTTPGFPNTQLPGAFTYEPPLLAPTDIPTLAQVEPNSGPTTGGGWAIVRGINLPENAQITFGGTAVTKWVAISPSMITVKVPAHVTPGAVDVQLTDPATSATSKLAQAYTYYAPDDAPGPAPTLAWIKPAIGPAAGGTLAWLSGTGFQAGALIFVAGRPGADVVVSGAGTATFRTPKGQPGAADVAIVNPDGQQASLAGAFAFTSGTTPSIKLTGALPTQGSVAGGTVVTVSGTGFVPGTTAFVDGVPAATKLTSPNAIELTTPAHGPGLADIQVTAPDGWTATLEDAYNFILQAPFIAGITPDFGPPAGGTQILITGKGFHAQAKVTVGDVPAQVLAASDGQITAVTPPGALGVVAVAVINPDYLSDTKAGAFTYTNEVPGDQVQVHAVNPPTGPAAGGTQITLTGTGFAADAAVIVGTGVCTGVQVLSETTILAVTPPGTVGPAVIQVVVPEKGTGTLPNGFFFHQDGAQGKAAQIGGVVPTIGPVAGGTIARVDVIPAEAGARVFFGGVEAQVLGADEAGHLVVRTAPHAAGVVPVSVMRPNGLGATLGAAFTFYVPAPGVIPPTLDDVQPTSGPTTGGQPVLYTGTGFGAEPIGFLGYKPLREAALTPQGKLSGKSPPNVAGLADAAVTRADGFSAVLQAAYGFTSPTPAPTKAFPTAGPLSGGTTVALSGTGFAVGADVFVGGVAATQVNVAADTVLTFVTPPGAVEGLADVEVRNPDGKFGVLPSAFDYVDTSFTSPPPVPQVLLPNGGPYQGGTTLVVYGTGFQVGALVLFGGKPGEVHLVSAAGDFATVTTPDGFVGPVDVTVINPDGQAGTLAAGFRYKVVPNPMPSLLGITPKSGPEAGGTALIFTGSNVTGGGVGLVGYRPVSSWTVLNSAIATGTSVKAPPGAADVVVTTGQGLSAKLTGGYTYVGAPKIDSFDPAIGAVAGGTVVHIAGANFSAQAKVEIGGQPAASVQVLSEFVITIQTPPAPPGPAQVKVTNPDGQKSVAADPFLYVLPPEATGLFPSGGRRDAGGHHRRALPGGRRGHVRHDPRGGRERGDAGDDPGPHAAGSGRSDGDRVGSEPGRAVHVRSHGIHVGGAGQHRTGAGRHRAGPGDRAQHRRHVGAAERHEPPAGSAVGDRRPAGRGDADLRHHARALRHRAVRGHRADGRDRREPGRRLRGGPRRLHGHRSADPRPGARDHLRDAEHRPDQGRRTDGAGGLGRGRGHGGVLRHQPGAGGGRRPGGRQGHQPGARDGRGGPLGDSHRRPDHPARGRVRVRAAAGDHRHRSHEGTGRGRDVRHDHGTVLRSGADRGHELQGPVL